MSSTGILGSRTASSRSDSDESDDERSSKKRRESHHLQQAGGMFGIVGDMWRNIGTIIKEGLQRSQATGTPDNVFSYRRNKYNNLFIQLCTLAPDLVQEIASGGPDGVRLVVDKLDKGRSKTRGDLVHGIKKAIPDWHTFLPEDGHRKNKARRGFHHDEYGRLLCPAALDWADPAVRTGIRNCNPMYRVSATDWPIFLWEDERLDMDNVTVGFLRGRLVVQAVIFMMHGPSAVGDSDQHGEIRTNGNRRPRAARHGVNHVTPAAIAYGAVLVHFAMSAQSHMSAGGSGGKWPYEAFYHALVEHVERYMDEPDRRDLLAWWKTQVFGAVFDESSDDEDGGDGHAGASIMTRMREQARSRQARSAAGSSATGAAGSSTMGGAGPSAAGGAGYAGGAGAVA
ncbi:hypothetical protein BV25DRAFT_1920340 [Artomyces pyxidatus]|uniref:Uncharacterized protein n=1 Tax=Artomyces pyxidatus TaxID=48021 RepID=A0ACB8SN89_9AGAM|nr:hypothetical protein BV25DRAFT_1920340 [Artomyces pyxidatus]